MDFATDHFEKIVIALSLILCKSGTRAYDDLQNTHGIRYQSYSLAEYSTDSVTRSGLTCAVRCLTKHDSGRCAAYEWDSETGVCRTQEKLNVTESDGDVMVMTETAIDCSAILAADPSSNSGVYSILVGPQQTRQVWCDMDTDGGGWTVFLKRLDGAVDFYLDLAAYKRGFGDVSGEYWLGLDVLHTLTSSKNYVLRADVLDWEGASVYSLYASVDVADEADNYRLTLGPFLGGEGGDTLQHHNGQQFSTKDADRDHYAHHSCAQKHNGGFWYNYCLLGNPTGRYYVGGPYNSNHNDGIQWRGWAAHDDYWYSMKTVDMKIRP